MATINIDPAAWAQEQFGTCELGDLRRTNRLVKVATQAASRPDGSTPDQTETWGDCKAVYRLMDCDDVTHAEIIRPHCEITKQSCAAGSVQLILCDTTEIDYQRSVEGLGPVGQGRGRGFFLHTGLMRDANSGVISGIAGQELFYRKPKRKKKVVDRVGKTVTFCRAGQDDNKSDTLPRGHSKTRNVETRIENQSCGES